MYGAPDVPPRTGLAVIADARFVLLGEATDERGFAAIAHQNPVGADLRVCPPLSRPRHPPRRTANL